MHLLACLIRNLREKIAHFAMGATFFHSMKTPGEFKGFTIGVAVMTILFVLVYLGTQDMRDPRRYDADVSSIPSEKAKDFIGRGLIVHGRIAEIKQWRDYTFVNFDAKYPKHTFALIIPPSLRELVEALPTVGEAFAVGGMIRADKNGKPCITATSQETIDPYGKLADAPSAALDPDRTGLKGMPY